MMMIGKQETMKTVGLITDDIGDQRGFVPQFLNLSQLFCANSTNQVLWKFAAQLRRFFQHKIGLTFFLVKLATSKFLIPKKHQIISKIGRWVNPRLENSSD